MGVGCDKKAPRFVNLGAFDLTCNLFRDHAMNAFGNWDNIHDLHVAQLRLGSDVFLEPWSERAA
jgi:hypothetical protein